MTDAHAPWPPLTQAVNLHLAAGIDRAHAGARGNYAALLTMLGPARSRDAVGSNLLCSHERTPL